ncbi:MAG: glycosyltransferase family 2 protein [Verrucomicrobiales bacterium]|nr:glycosyltransferase family 2 protein [Verrucomicrobiales bacterium]
MMEWEHIIWFTCYVLVFAGLSIFGAHRIKILYYFWKHRQNEPMAPRRFDELPRVTVQLPIFNELHVLDRLLQSVAELDYPRDRLQIQVLDDSTDETAAAAAAKSEELRQSGLDIQYLHRTDRSGFKAGALDAAMAGATGEFICIFDADFQPAPDYLQKLIHHFTDEKVGMVQARWGHINRDYSLLTKLQALFLDGHLVLEQSARSREGYYLNFNGTAGIWRASVIADAGGWQHDTLTEDLDLSYRAQLKGWKFIYLTDVVVPAELPPDMDSFKSQQHRWTKGSIQVCKKILGDIWRSEVPLRNKIEATAHLTSNFAYMLTLCTLVLMYPANFVLGSSWQKAVFVDIPVFLFASLSVIMFYLVAQGAQKKGAWIKALPYLPALLALGIGMSVNNGKAVIEALFNRQSDFVRTPKFGVENERPAQKKAVRYKAGRSLSLWIEVAIVLYFAAMIALAISRGQWMSLPFLALFFGGFGYVAWGSLNKRFALQPAPVTA